MVLFCMKENNSNTNTNTMSHDETDLELKKPHQLKDNNLKEHTNMDVTKGTLTVEAEEESGREKLKRHRVEMAGRVWIPDMWGQEEFLKDWIDCTTFDPPLISSAKIVTARTALVQEATAATARC
ncbi:protein BIC1-like [Vicia villosa]|uniref:protein BIC1-like n=1 Tax=Vicia villosa TaxID=3911 RepID=UPI00273C4FC6|nr:protein BIC1-like [Vicia villosa]